MKQFFKTMFASFLGTLLVIALMFVVSIMICAGSIASLSSGDKAVVVKPHTVLQMKLDYSVNDRTPSESFDFNLGLSSLRNLTGGLKASDNTGLNDIIRNLNAAAKDPNIDGIYLDLSSVGASSATLKELRDKLLEFKESGKFIISYSEGYTQGAYYLASVADEVMLNPDGMLDLHGMSAQITFYKHVLDKLGVNMQIVRGPNNRFKSAVEPYFLDKMSEANREQMETLLGSVWNDLIDDISASRGISTERLNQIADSIETMFSADKALEDKLVDRLAYKDEVLDRLKELTGTEKINSINNADYAIASKETNTSKDKIAIVYAIGEISGGEGSDTSIGSETTSKAIRKARTDKDVKAIVLRVNSPGGSAVASEIIRREIELAKKDMPVIVSMGDYAASGGYWISTNTDHIFAQPTTLTGSIGVFGVIPDAHELLTEKVGVTFDVAKTNANADFGSLTQPLTPFQHAKLNESVSKTYNDFTSLVGKTRGLRQSYVDSIGQGRVWSGRDALEIGLVDELGGLEKAIAYAANKAGLEDYSITELPRQKKMMEKLMEMTKPSNDIDAVLKANLGSYYPYFAALKHIATANEPIQARMPFDMVIE